VIDGKPATLQQQRKERDNQLETHTRTHCQGKDKKPQRERMEEASKKKKDRPRDWLVTAECSHH
jgi:hypothetical protein